MGREVEVVHRSFYMTVASRSDMMQGHQGVILLCYTLFYDAAGLGFFDKEFRTLGEFEKS